MKHLILTVSRQFGSGGHTISRMVAKNLGIPCYDKELIEQVARESGFLKEYVQQAGEFIRPGFSFYNRAFGPANEDYLWRIQCQVITRLAMEGPCVIVGRCADYVLRQRFCLRVFLHADLAFRAQRIVSLYGQRDQSPQQRLKEMDKRRAAYYRFYTDQKWGRSENYDLTLNTGRSGLDQCAAILTELYENRRASPHPPREETPSPGEDL